LAVYKHPLRYARNELNIYVEYALRDLGYATLPAKFDKKVRNYLNIQGADDEVDYPGRKFLLSHFN